MNMSTLKALTWGTVAAAVLSALMLASGELDNEIDVGSSSGVGILMPTDNASGKQWRTPPDANRSDTRQRPLSGQR